MRLLTLPLTMARLPLKAAGAVMSAAAELVLPTPSGPTPSAPAPTAEPPAPRFVREEAPRRRRPDTGNGGEPAHVSEEPVLVAEAAEPGAEEGAGAEVHVDEPWSGYRDMTAAQIRQRLRTATLAEAAAVSLYEAGGKGRTSVLEEAGRRTRA
jgi:hypothetical protein